MAKIRRLMLPEQPQSIDPLHLAKNKEHIEGFLSLDSLGRLDEILLDNGGRCNTVYPLILTQLGYV